MTPYLTVDDAQLYFDEKLNVEPWDNSSGADKYKSLIMATRAIDNLNFSGVKTLSTQELEFPRGGDTTTPQAILDACCEIALTLLDGVDPDLEFENLKMVSQGYANVRSTYDVSIAGEHVKVGIPSITAWRLILPFLRDTETINLSRVS